MPILRDKWMCRFTYVQNAAKNGVSASQNTLKMPFWTLLMCDF